MARLKGLHEHLVGHQRVDRVREGHVARVPEVVVELPQVPRLARQVHLRAAQTDAGLTGDLEFLQLGLGKRRM